MVFVKIAAILFLQESLFWVLGDLFAGWFAEKPEQVSRGLRMITGFFAYYALFQAAALPMMFWQRPLHELAALWSAVVCLILGVYAFRQFRKSKSGRQRVTAGPKAGNTGLTAFFWNLVPAAVALANVILVSVIYSSYWDAAYYVGNISFAVYSDTIGIYNPLYGTVMQEFDLKHCLATYHMHDAVVCQLFGLHPLIQAKTVMVIVVTVLLNRIYLEFARLFFPEDVCARGLMCGFCLLVNVCTYSAYTSSSFILLRTYEGKAVAGAVVAAMLFYWLLRLARGEGRYGWAGLFITCWGAVAVSSSAVFLVLAGSGAVTLSLCFLKREWKLFFWGAVCALPALCVLLAYLLNRLGVLHIRIG